QNAAAPTFNGSNFTVFLTTPPPIASLNDPFTYSWTAVDSQGHAAPQQTGANAQNFSFQGSTANSYTVTLTITDAHNAQGTATSLTQVAAPAVTTTLSPSTPAGTQILAIAGAGS